MKDIADDMPYWRYRHSNLSNVPREQHLEWNGMVLRHDDPWWNTHYPPNGWGCKCWVEALSESDMRRYSLKKDKAPPLNRHNITIRRKGGSVTVGTPKGIDPGFAYAPGRLRQLANAATVALSKNKHTPTEAGDDALTGYSKSTYYKELNLALRAGNPAPLVRRIRDILNRSLALRPADPNLPTTPLYRRLQLTEQQIEGLLLRYRRGAVVTENAFTSTSRDPELPGYKDRNVLFVVYSHSGRDIADIAYDPSLKEVLIPAGARFKVVQVDTRNPAKPVITLREVE